MVEVLWQITIRGAGQSWYANRFYRSVAKRKPGSLRYCDEHKAEEEGPFIEVLKP